MIIGIYNIEPVAGCYLADYLKTQHFILDTDEYLDFFGTELREGSSKWYETLKRLIDICLKQRNYPGAIIYEVGELKFDKNTHKYYFANNLSQEFMNATKIEQVTHTEQMNRVWQELLPVIEKMIDAYPNAKIEPIFNYSVDLETKGVKVSLKELKFTIED